MEPLVSIAICTYNGEKHLREQLDSLVNQTYPNLEIVAVDDRSTDNTFQILTDYAAKYPFFKCTQNEQNLGYIRNFETTIKLCKGTFIALSDQDDNWHPDKISRLVEHAGGHSLIYHNSLFTDQEGASMNKYMDNVVNMYSGSDPRAFLLFNSVSGHACMINRSLLEKCLPFPTDVFHDRWLAYTAANADGVHYLDEVLVNYRQHNTSDTDILKLRDKKRRNKPSGKHKIGKRITELKVFRDYSHNRLQQLNDRIVHLFEQQLNSYLAPGLMFLLFRHYKSLLFILRTDLKRINFAFSHIWGGKLKS